MKASTEEDMTKLLRRIARNVRGVRLRNGLTQAGMTELGVGFRWYQRLESGRHVPTIRTLQKLARIFKTDISEFFQ